MDSPRILVVEDDPVNLMVITRMLRRLGHEADIAKNGLEAVEAASRRRYDLIFMDLMMPELDGIQAASRIRNQESGDHPMIVAVTANVMQRDRDAALAAGMNDYVTKPIRLETISDIVSSHTVEAKTAEVPEVDPDMLDMKVFQELRDMMGDDSFFMELVDEFVENSDELVHEIVQAYSDQNWDSAARAAHSLKSTSATFGGTSLTRLLKNIEGAANQRAADRAPGALMTLREERDRLIGAIQGVLAA